MSPGNGAASTRVEGHASARVQWIGLGLVSCVALLWWAGFDTSRFLRPDAHDYAQMGRELREGRGFSTLQIFPRHVAWLDERGRLGDERWPNLHRYPMPTLTHAAAQLVDADPARAAVLQSGLPFLVSVGLVYFLGLALGGVATGLLAALLFVGEPPVFASAYDGMSEALAGLLLLAATAVAISGRPGTVRWLALGALCGLGALARSQLLLLLPAASLCAALRAGSGRRALAVAIVIAATLLVMSPWLVRNARVAGDGFFSFSSTRNLMKGIHPDLDMDLDAPVEISEILSAHGETIVAKALRSAGERLVSGRHWLEAFGAMGIAALILVVASLLLGRAPPALGRFAAGGLLLLAANFALLCLTFHTERFWVTFRPLLLLAGAAALVSLLEPWRVSHRGARTALLAALFAFAAGRIALEGFQHEAAADPSPGGQAALAAVARRTPPDAWIASDLSDQVALHARRRSLRLPLEPAQLLEIDASRRPIDYVVLSPQVTRGGPEPAGSAVLQRQLRRRYRRFAGSGAFTAVFEEEARLPGGGVLYRRR